MYQVNQLKRKVLIMPDEVVFHSDMKDINPKNILAAIIIAEERFIKKLICKDLYLDFRDKKNVIVDFSNITDLTDKVNQDNTGEPIVLQEGFIINSIDFLSENDEDDPYIDLWNEYLWKITAECVLFTSLPDRWIQSKPAGEMLNNPLSMTSGADAASADLKSIQWKSNKLLMDRIEPLIEAMKEWLCDNKDRFEKFNCYRCPEDPSRSNSLKKKTPWVSGVYDDDCRRNRLRLSVPGSISDDGDDNDADDGQN